MSDSKDRYIFKITVIGDPAVGKTSLIKKYTQGSFNEDYIKTIGAQFSKFVEEINDTECELFLWDIAGQDTYHFLRPAFYEGSRAAIIVYSLEKSNHGKKSFEHVDEWHDDIKAHCGDIPVILFANKVDLVDESKIKEKKLIKLVKKLDLIGYYKTSAKTGDGVVNAFHSLVRELLDIYKN